MRSSLNALGIVAVIALAPIARAEDSPDDLIGGYTVVSGEKYGVPEPEDRVEGTIVRITSDAIVVTTKDKKDVYAASYKIESRKRPWRITMTSKLAPNEGEVAQGLIDKEGDTVRLIYSLPGGQVPTEFKTQEKQLMFVMKNENPKKGTD